MTEPLTVHVAEDPDMDLARIVVVGEVDPWTVRNLREVLAEVGSRRARLEIDLRETGYLDSSGVHALFDAAETRRVEIVVRPTSFPAAVLRACRLDEIVTIRHAE